MSNSVFSVGSYILVLRLVKPTGLVLETDFLSGDGCCMLLLAVSEVSCCIGAVVAVEVTLACCCCFLTTVLRLEAGLTEAWLVGAVDLRLAAWLVIKSNH